MESVPFNFMPASLRIPGARFEINTGERPFQTQSRVVYIAPMLASGTAAPGVPIRMPSNPIAAFGAGSIAAEVAILARRQASLYELWMLPVADVAGTKDAATITVNSVPAPGSYRFWVLGRQRSVLVTAADTTTTLAAKIATAAAASFYLPGYSTGLTMPFTAASAVAVATLTGRHNGSWLNGTPWIDFELYGETSPLKSAVTVAYTATGTGVPDMAAALAAVGDLAADWFGSVYNDAGSVAALANFVDARWLPMSMKYGIAVYARQGTYGTLGAAGAVMNDRARVVLGQNDSPSPTWLFMAQGAAELAQYYDLGAALTEAQRLARGITGHVLRDALPPRSGFNAFTDAERNSLYFDGITPLTATMDGKVTLERVITTYQVDSFGLDDVNFLDINYPLIDVYCVRFLQNYIWSRHANTSIVNDTEPGRAGQTRPKDLRDSFIHGYLKLRNEAGIVEDVDGMIDRLKVERSSDPTRANVLLSTDRANPLHVIATNVQASAQFQG